MTNKELINRALEMVNAGASMEDALQAMLRDAASGTSRGPRVDWISVSEDIQELRKAIKSSNGMKSKMKNNPIAVERYIEEIKVGQNRLNQIFAAIDNSDDKIEAARNYNADSKDLLNIWLNDTKEELDERFVKAIKRLGLSKSEGKKIRFAEDATTPEYVTAILKEIGNDVLAEYEDRLQRGDRWLETLNKTYRFIER